MSLNLNLTIDQYNYLNINSELLAKFNLICDQLYSDDNETKLIGLASLRTIISEPLPPIELIISHGFIQKFIGVLNVKDPLFLRELCYVIQGIAIFGKQQIVATSGAIDILKIIFQQTTLDNSENVRVKDVAVQSMGQIAINKRELVLESNLFPLLLDQLNSTPEKNFETTGNMDTHNTLLYLQSLQSLKQSILWALTTLSIGQPKPSNQNIVDTVVSINHFLQQKQQTDEYSLSLALWTVANLSNNADQEQIDLIIKSGIAPQILHYLNINEWIYTTVKAALISFANLVSGSEKSTLYMIGLNSLPLILRILDSQNEELVVEAIWSITNIFGSRSANLIQMVIDAAFLPKFVEIMISSPSKKIRNQLLNCYLTFTTDTATQMQIDYFMVNHHCFWYLCQFVVADPRTLRNDQMDVTLEILTNILNKQLYDKNNKIINNNNNSSNNNYVMMLKQLNMLKKLEGVTINYSTKNTTKLIEDLSYTINNDTDSEEDEDIRADLSEDSIFGVESQSSYDEAYFNAEVEEDEVSEDSISEEDNAELLAKLNGLLDKLISTDENEILEGCVALRKMVSSADTPPIDAVVNAGFVPMVLAILRDQDNPQTQTEACWIITNIVSGTSSNVNTVIELGGLNILNSLLDHRDPRLREQVIWAIGNIAGDCASHRDLVLQSNVLPLLLGALDNCNLAMKRLLVWTISNLCRGKPKPDSYYMEPILPQMKEVITYETDQATLIDALWALSYMSDTANEDIHTIIKSGIVPQLVRYLDSNQLQLVIPALRAYGNLVTGDDKSTLYMVSLKTLPILLKLLDSPDNDVLKETVWTISNIVACPANIIQLCVEAMIFPKLVSIFDSVDSQVRREILWCYSNIVDGGDAEQIDYLMLNLRCYRVICKKFEEVHDNLLEAEISLVISSLENVFKHSNKSKEYLSILAEYNIANVLLHISDGEIDEQLYEKVEVFRKFISKK
ncbi:ATIMPALPHA3/MOS6; protein transporter [Heterostelium album PN500]|uniref:ATIMPALPHA3/MOS6 protein transporter n=1 Tax=Heterostelium pallidum (strain ATCC 26659 / Pp 5 / PN500) TaxID=670386 RepID=D3B4E9_HETP5|nr:ATIMPALPHA3/MOS6; protein transporter [Heterostelium album PN500]EFA84197.1 ATIMPALPHA3/MOS6; protein transporter [Heterostelium album PN500]|eukprot:XP_020436313.1 ATIMPALPHA3/MOS6; protein transporter [Heterostelium album PN500]